MTGGQSAQDSSVTGNFKSVHDLLNAYNCLQSELQQMPKAKRIYQKQHKFDAAPVQAEVKLTESDVDTTEIG
jgi:hypothetical protein